MNTPSDRLRHARIAARFGRAVDAAERFGWQKSTYYGHENGSRGISAKSAVVYSKAFGVTANWLLYGEGIEKVAIDQLSDEMPASDQASADSISGYDGHFVTVPQIKTNLNDAAPYPLARSYLPLVSLAADYLRLIGLEPQNLRCLVASGDAMFPTLHDGDLVIVEVNRHAEVYEGVFLLTDRAQNTLLRRLSPASSPGSVIMIPDNRLYAPVELGHSDLVVHGRVVWIGKKM